MVLRALTDRTSSTTSPADVADTHIITTTLSADLTGKPPSTPHSIGPFHLIYQGEKKEENGGEAEKTEKTEAIEEAMVTLGAEDEPPEHVMTDRYGFPLTDASTLQYNLSDGQVRVYTQYWRTRFTAPPTKPNCLCLTRGPLPLFKLIGNLHFKHIKQGNRRRSSTTESGSTICPPCDCATCFTTEGTTERRNKLC